MSTEILDYLVSFLKKFFHQKRQRGINTKYYLTFFLTMTNLYARYGIYGATFSRGYGEIKLNKSSITGKINKAQLFISVVDAGALICNYNTIEPFSGRFSRRQVGKYIKHFTMVFHEYTDFMIVCFLGAQFNQEPLLNSAVNCFHQDWTRVVSELAKIYWKSEKLANQVAENSLVYLLGQLYQAQASENKEGRIHEMCDTLRDYWTGRQCMLLGDKGSSFRICCLPL
jgi:hypothetical protein